MTSPGTPDLERDLKAELLEDLRTEMKASREIARAPFVSEYLDFGSLVDDESPRHFLCCLPSDLWSQGRRAITEGRRLRWVSAGGLVRCGVRPGDFLYVVAMVGSRVFMVGRMCVESYVSRTQVMDWPGGRRRGARDHVAGRKGTPIRFSRQVPREVLYRLEILEQRGRRRLGNQPLKGVYELHPTSAQELDKLLLEDSSRQRRK